MNFYAVSALFNFITSALVGGSITYRKPGNRLHQIFGFFALTVCIWSFGYLIWQLSATAEKALFWAKFFMSGAIFTPISFLHFTLHFTDTLEKYKDILYAGYAIFSLFFCFNILTPYFITGVGPELSFAFWPQKGVLFSPFLFLWMIFAIFSIYILFEFYKNTRGSKKYQTKYILYGIVIGYVGGITNYFLWYEIPVKPFGTVSASIYLSLVAYAIVKHNLFNLKVILTEIFSWILVAIVLVNLFLSNSSVDLFKNLIIFVAVSIFVYLLIQSVYKKVEARRESEKLNKKLKKMNEQKSKMLSIASHQFRSPLTSIEGYASLMKNGSYGNIPEHLQKPINRIVKSSKKLGTIVNDFLNISRIEDGRMEYNFSVAGMEGIVREVLEEAEGAIDGENLDLELETDESENYYANVDIGKIEQVITNLIDNAIKYTETGNITARLKKKKGNIIIEVEDTGIGIDPEDADEIFEQFSRADEAEDVNVVGSGLGLYIAKQIVKAHDGKIWATSPGKGEGSTFHVKLQAAKK